MVSEGLLEFATERQAVAIRAYLEHGSYGKAAKALGIHESSLHNLIKRTKKHAKRSGCVDQPEVNKESHEAYRRLEEEKRKVAALKMLVDEQEKLIADFVASRFDFPKKTINKFTAKGSTIRIAFGDTHGSSIDLPAWKAFISDAEMLKPKEAVHLGDIVECGGWLAAHHTTNYVAQTSYTYSDDIIGANLMCDDLQRACPLADIHFIEGNHDARVATWCITMAQKNRADVDFLLDRLGPESLLSIKKRGIHWWSRGEVHPGSVVGGTLKLGKCFFTHPSSSSKNHAAATAAKFGHNVVYGHTHRADFYPGGDVEGREWAAWSPGCLCKLRKYFHHTEPFRHNHGYHVQLVKSDGTFLGINVPIISGKSYMSGLLKLGL